MDILNDIETLEAGKLHRINVAQDRAEFVDAFGCNTGDNNKNTYGGNNSGNNNNDIRIDLNMKNNILSSIS